jgi:hypothetical protein
MMHEPGDDIYPHDYFQRLTLRRTFRRVADIFVDHLTVFLILSVLTVGCMVPLSMAIAKKWFPLVMMLLLFFFMFIGRAAMIIGVADIYSASNNPSVISSPDVRHCLDRVKPHLFPLLVLLGMTGAPILLMSEGLATFGEFVLDIKTVTPAHFKFWAALVFDLCFFSALIYTLAFLIITVPVMVLEDKDPFSAIKRSNDLSYGSRAYLFVSFASIVLVWFCVEWLCMVLRKHWFQTTAFTVTDTVILCLPSLFFIPLYAM